MQSIGEIIFWDNSWKSCCPSIIFPYFCSIYVFTEKSRRRATLAKSYILSSEVMVFSETNRLV